MLFRTPPRRKLVEFKGFVTVDSERSPSPPPPSPEVETVSAEPEVVVNSPIAPDADESRNNSTSSRLRMRVSPSGKVAHEFGIPSRISITRSGKFNNPTLTDTSNASSKSEIESEAPSPLKG
jgi:hypothetical protein